MLEFSALAKVNWSSNFMYVGNVLVPCLSSLVENHTLEDQQKRDGTYCIHTSGGTYFVTKYVPILASYKNAHQIICVNDPYSARYQAYT